MQSRKACRRDTISILRSLIIIYHHLVVLLGSSRIPSADFCQSIVIATAVGAICSSILSTRRQEASQINR